MGTEDEGFPWNPFETCASGHRIYLGDVPDRSLFVGSLKCSSCADELDFKAVKRRHAVYFMWREDRRELADRADDIYKRGAEECLLKSLE